MKSGPTCKEAAILHNHISTVAQIMDLLRVSWFYLDMTAGVRKKEDKVGRQETENNITMVSNILFYH